MDLEEERGEVVWDRGEVTVEILNRGGREENITSLNLSSFSSSKRESFNIPIQRRWPVDPEVYNFASLIKLSVLYCPCDHDSES